MADRLTRIYTRSGDKGTTSLGSGERVAKDDSRIESLGTLDELNCQLGVLLAILETDDPIGVMLTPSQHRLFDIGGEVAMDSTEYRVIEQSDVDQLEQQLDQLNEQLPPLKEFILPGGNQPAASAHLSRAICRRAERRLQTMASSEQLNPFSLAYVNRLSDLLFVCARVLARRDQGAEVLWQPKAKG